MAGIERRRSVTGQCLLLQAPLLLTVTLLSPVIIVAAAIHQLATAGKKHYYLNILGSEPAARGLGAAAALVDRLIHLATTSGTSLYLETSGDQNPAWYKRRGMWLKHKMQVEGSDGSLLHQFGGFAAMVFEPHAAKL